MTVRRRTAAFVPPQKATTTGLNHTDNMTRNERFVGPFGGQILSLVLLYQLAKVFIALVIVGGCSSLNNNEKGGGGGGLVQQAERRV